MKIQHIAPRTPRPLKWTPLKACLALAVATPAAVLAQDGAAPEFTRMDDLVVTASRVEERGETVPANVTVITAEDFEDTTATTVPDVLRSVAGVTVSGWLGTGRQTSVDIRSFGETAGANTLVLVDGRRINPPDLSGLDWTTIPLERIERIEVVRGLGSVMYGDFASAGVINIITRKGTEEPRVDSDTTVGSYDYFKQSLNLSGGRDGWYYAVNGSYTDTDGYRDNGYWEAKTAGLRLGYDKGAGLGVDISAGTKDDEYGMPGALPEGAPRKSTNFPVDSAESDSYYLDATPKFTFKNGAVLSLGLNMRHYHSYSQGVSFGFPWEFEYDLDEYGIQPAVRFTVPVRTVEHRINTGVDFRASNLDPENQGESDRRQWGWYIADRVALHDDRLFLNLGYRHATTDYELAGNNDRDYANDAANIGVSFLYGEGSSVFASIEKGFRTMRMQELGGAGFNEFLPPQTSLHYQAGVEHRFDATLTAGATVFWIDTDDEILYDPNLLPPGGFFPGTNTNYEETRRQGIELEMRASPHDKVDLSANYTWVNAELQGGAYDEKEIPGTSRHAGNAALTVLPIEHLTVDARVHWEADRTPISDWNNQIDDWDDDYFVTNVLATYELGKWSFYAGVNNLFDTQYSEHAVIDWTGQFTHYPSPERNGLVGVKFETSF